MWRFFAAAVACCLVGCADGRLVMQLDLPGDPQLDPTQDCSSVGCSSNLRLARYSLRITRQDGDTRNQEAVASTIGELTVGSVPVDTPFDLRLAGQSGTGQVLGVGRVRDVQVDARGDTLVSLKFRKPIGYIAGGTSLRVFDVSAARDLEKPALGLANVLDVAATPNGVLFVALQQQHMIRVRTADHFAVGCTQPLGSCAKPESLGTDPKFGTASCIAIRPDSDAALLCRGQGVQPVFNLSGDTPAPVDPFGVGAQVQRTSAIAFEPTRAGSRPAAWVLGNGIQRTCSGEKSILSRAFVDRANDKNGEADSSVPPIELGYAAADVAVDPIDPSIVYVVTPCTTNTIVAYRDRQPVYKLTEGAVPKAYDIAVTDSKIILIGEAPRVSVGNDFLPLQAQAIIIERTDPSRPPLPQSAAELTALTRTFDVPTISVRFQTSSSDQGFLFWSLDAQNIKVHNFQVSPDGQRALLNTETRYASNLSLSSCQYNADVIAHGIMLVDINGGTVLYDALTQLEFSQCSSNCITGANTQAGCEAFFRDGLQARGRLSRTPYVPSGGAILFGGR
ncbi:MAG: hypothetical protein KC503_23140 [Myxococcales bacterium]|nr:hypothetical protein [Myxococcales bacterium]